MNPCPTPPILNGELVAALAYIALCSKGQLRVLDFGGGSGGVYWDTIPFLPPSVKVSWSVVDQNEQITLAKKHLGQYPLKYFYTTTEAEKNEKPDVILLSGVLQYIEDPDFISACLDQTTASFVIIARLPIQHSGEDYVTIQHIPKALAIRRTFPVWKFDYDKMMKRMSDRLELIWQADVSDCGPAKLMLLKRK